MCLLKTGIVGNFPSGGRALPATFPAVRYLRVLHGRVAGETLLYPQSTHHVDNLVYLSKHCAEITALT